MQILMKMKIKALSLMFVCHGNGKLATESWNLHLQHS